MANKVNVSFDKEHNGLLKSETFETKVSYRGDGMAPYELFLGGFASCLHATFIGIMKKRKLEFETASYEVVGYKREEVPTILNKVVTTIVLTGTDESKREKIEKSMEQAERYCSISDTINNLGAEMIFNIEFK